MHTAHNKIHLFNYKVEHFNKVSGLSDFQVLSAKLIFVRMSNLKKKNLNDKAVMISIEPVSMKNYSTSSKLCRSQP